MMRILLCWDLLLLLAEVLVCRSFLGTVFLSIPPLFVLQLHPVSTPTREDKPLLERSQKEKNHAPLHHRSSQFHKSGTPFIAGTLQRTNSIPFLKVLTWLWGSSGCSYYWPIQSSDAVRRKEAQLLCKYSEQLLRNSSVKRIVFWSSSQSQRLIFVNGSVKRAIHNPASMRGEKAVEKMQSELLLSA